MLGRYIAGTLLILGAAMMVAPEAPEKPEIPVARTESSPVALATAQPTAMAAAVLASVDQPAVSVEKQAEIVPAVASTKSFEAGVEAALVQALALDATEQEQIELEETAASAEPAPETAGIVLAATPADSSIAERPARVLFVTGSRVNVRSGPSTQYRVVGTVSNGEPVELVSFEGASWARIRFENGETTGYMSRQFLTSEAGDG